MNLLSKLTGRERKNELVGMKSVSAIGYDDSVLANHENYSWYSESYKSQALAQIEDMFHARELGLRNQAGLQAREVVRTVFKDYTEGNGLDANKLTLHQLSDNNNTGLFRLNDRLDLWYMHPLDTKSLRLSREALRAVERLQGFPKPFVQDVKILEAVKQSPIKSKDYRFSDERPFFSPMIIAEPDPILAVKIAEQWYSVLKWE